MSDTSSIEWTEATLNPWTGCTKISPGCAHCYIASTPPFRINHRRFVGGHIPLVFHMDRLDRMVRRRRPTLYFVNSLSDLFHEDATDEQVGRVFAAMAAAPQHTFQVLTKRPDRMQALMAAMTDPRRAIQEFPGFVRGFGSRSFNVTWPLPNVWLGVTVENRRFVGRADVLRDTPAAVRFLSCEPLLGPLLVPGAHARDGRQVWRWPDGHLGRELDLTGIDWLIVGGESGKGYRPFDLQWARDLRDASAAAGTAFFVKQLGGYRPGNRLEDLPEDLRIREMPRTVATDAVAA